MSIAELIRSMAAVGAPSEAIALAVEAIEAAQTVIAAQRSKEAERTRRYRARGGGAIPEDMRQAVFDRDGHVCLECGSADYLQCDHVHPVSKGGATTMENLQTLCRVCNARKKDRVRKANRNSTEFHGTPTESKEAPFLSPPSPTPPTTTNLSPTPPIVPPSQAEKPPAKPDDVATAFDLWNETAKLCDLPRAKTLDPTRRRAIRQRLDTGGLELWGEAMDAVKRSAFLRGLRTGGDGRVFKADLTFVCQAKSYQRLVDGGYGDDGPRLATEEPVIVTPAEQQRRERHFRDTGEWRPAWGKKPEEIAA